MSVEVHVLLCQVLQMIFSVATSDRYLIFVLMSIVIGVKMKVEVFVLLYQVMASVLGYANVMSKNIRKRMTPTTEPTENHCISPALSIPSMSSSLMDFIDSLTLEELDLFGEYPGIDIYREGIYLCHLVWYVGFW